jgi:hypothetical protein
MMVGRSPTYSYACNSGGSSELHVEQLISAILCTVQSTSTCTVYEWGILVSTTYYCYESDRISCME